MNFIFFLSLTLLIILIPYLISGLSYTVFYPTPISEIKKAIKLINIKKPDKAIDLGSGDGRFLFEISKYCREVEGVEIQPILVLYTKLKVILGKYKNIEVKFKDLWSVNLSEYNLIFIFAIKSRMDKLERKILKEVKKGTKVITYAFKLPNLKYKKYTKNGLYLYEV
jgi:16S rRNA A1518/A1519 N6-dimethyltransferase RsmA/KsgA/DIM1 with predicted DNA glycosylase/AP lyase activity